MNNIFADSPPRILGNVPPHMRGKVLLFVLNFNGTRMTCDLLTSLRKSGFPYDVWVVDNGSKQDDSERFITAFPGITVKSIDDNCGFAGGVNRAMLMAYDEGYDYAYEINNDTLVTDDFLTPCLEIMEQNPNVDIVGSRVLNRDETTGKYTIWGFHSHPKEASTFPDGFLETRHVLGCGMLLRVKTFLEFGGLDERFFCYGEENDYCYRLAKAGREQGIAAKSLIRHQGKLTTGGIWTRYWGARNTILFSRLHDSSWQDSGSVLIKRSLIPGFKHLFHGDFEKTAAAGHGYADAIRGRYGKRTRPFHRTKGTLLFLFLSPFIFIYALSIHSRLHPWRPRPEP